MSDTVHLSSGVVLRTVGEDDAPAMLDALLRNRDHLMPFEAGTAPANVASQRVLLKNGFAQYGTARSHLFLDGAWQDSFLFERILDDRPPAAG